jgi:hypothetical protein
MIFSFSAETVRMPHAVATADTSARGEGQAAGFDRAL